MAGLLTDADYRDFVFTNPAFLDDRPVEAAAKELLRAKSGVAGG